MKKYTKEQIRKAFEVWETRYKDDPEAFTDYDKEGFDIERTAKDKTDYLIELIEEREDEG